MFQFMKLKKRLLNQSKEAKAEVLIILKQIWHILQVNNYTIFSIFFQKINNKYI